MTMPNFIVVGAQKSGTTALHHVLAQHPQIFMSSVKEPRFFCFEHHPPQYSGPGSAIFNGDAVTQLSEYQALFDGVTGESAVGESSTDYTTGKNVEHIAENMWHHLPNVRIIAILRQPADRAYSAFNFARQNGFEPIRDFIQALAVEDSDERANWPPNHLYWRNGCYYTQLKPYFDRYPRQQIRIHLYEEWIANPTDVVSDICRFLDVDDTFQFDFSLRQNVTRARRSIMLHKLFVQSSLAKSLFRHIVPQPVYNQLKRHVYRLNSAKPPPFDPALRHLLTRSYRNEILQLQELIGRDLAHWLNPARF